MTRIQVFIASSSRDTAQERLVVGDVVRKLSDHYEPRGYRIQLGCWEDFAPEFTGTRKQTEYNEQLIAKSQLFFALFRSVCGQFTQEEVKYWQGLGREPFVLDIQDPAANKADVQTFILTQGLSPIQVSTDADIEDAVNRAVADYIAVHPADGKMETTPVKQVYATIPDDRKMERLPFSHVIRGIDDMAERSFHLRCRLTTQEPSQVIASDYFAAILKDHLSSDEKFEVLTAISRSVATHRPEVALYYNYGDQVCTNHPTVREAITRAGLFNEPFDNQQRVRYNLLRWLLRQTVLRIDLSAGISINEGWFLFFGLPVVKLSELGITVGSVADQTAELIRQLSFALLGAGTSSVSPTAADVDLAAFDAEVHKTDTLFNVASEIEQAAQARRQELLNTVSDAIDAILAAGVTEDNIKKLTDLIQRKEQLQTKLVAEPREILRTVMLIVQIHDTYPDLFATTDIDIDQQYLKVTQIADRFGIVDPTVEMMRMNYANYLSGQNRNREALTLYEAVMERLNSLDNRSVLYRFYIMHLYVTYINHLSFLGQNDRAYTTIHRLESLMSQWEDYDLSEAEKVANSSRLLACKLRIRPLKEDTPQLINEAIQTYKLALSQSEESFDEFVCDEVYCDLPICIASTLMDAIRDDIVLPNVKAFKTVLFCLSNVITFARLHPESPTSKTYLGNALHNLGFFFSNTLGDQLKARKHCLDALRVREDIYSATRHPNDLYDVAQTLLLLGATYVNDRHSPLTGTELTDALGFADRCLAIYSELNTEHYLEQDTRYYEALQLKGSILYYGGEESKASGLALLKQVWDWCQIHPENNYQGVFLEVSGKILQVEGWI